MWNTMFFSAGLSAHRFLFLLNWHVFNMRAMFFFIWFDMFFFIWFLDVFDFYFPMASRWQSSELAVGHRRSKQPQKAKPTKGKTEGYVGASLMYVNYSVLIFSVRACAGICQTMLGNSKVFQRFHLEARPSEVGSSKRDEITISHNAKYVHSWERQRSLTRRIRPRTIVRSV